MRRRQVCPHAARKAPRTLPGKLCPWWSGSSQRPDPRRSPAPPCSVFSTLFVFVVAAKRHWPVCGGPGGGRVLRFRLNFKGSSKVLDPSLRIANVRTPEHKSPKRSATFGSAVTVSVLELRLQRWWSVHFKRGWGSDPRKAPGPSGFWL